MEKLSVGKAYGLMWSNVFNYRDVAGRREYWLPVLVTAIVGVIGLIISVLAMNTNSRACVFIAWIIDIYFAISIIPFISLTVRRLHDTGKSGWWTCLLLAVGVGTLWLLMMCASSASSSFNPYNNQAVDVYGPPEWFNEYSPNRNEEAGVYGAPNWSDDYEPGDNVNVDVYGSPEWSDDDYNPDKNVNEDVYGPPEWFGDGEDNEK